MDGPNAVIPKVLFDEAVEFHKLMKSGHTIIGAEDDQIDMPHERPIARPGASMPPGMSNDLDDEIPFAVLVPMLLPLLSFIGVA